jgi:hypothetical protein
MSPPELDELNGPFDSSSQWAQVPELIRKDVEQHVLANLPAEVMVKLRHLHALGIPIETDPAFFHFGGGMAVRNLCREQLTDDELATYCLFGDWDTYYIAVLAAIAATPVS